MNGKSFYLLFMASLFIAGCATSAKHKRNLLEVAESIRQIEDLPCEHLRMTVKNVRLKLEKAAGAGK